MTRAKASAASANTSSQAKAEAHERSSMDPTVTATAPRRHYRRPSRLAVYVAPQLGMQPGAVEQLIHGHDQIQVRFAALVAGALALDDRSIYAKLMAPVNAAHDRAPRLEEPAALRIAGEADALEEIAEVQYLTCRTPETRETFRRRIRDQISTSVALLRAMDASEAGCST